VSPKRVFYLVFIIFIFFMIFYRWTGKALLARQWRSRDPRRAACAQWHSSAQTARAGACAGMTAGPGGTGETDHFDCERSTFPLVRTRPMRSGPSQDRHRREKGRKTRPIGFARLRGRFFFFFFFFFFCGFFFCASAAAWAGRMAGGVGPVSNFGLHESEGGYVSIRHPRIRFASGRFINGVGPAGQLAPVRQVARWPRGLTVGCFFSIRADELRLPR